MNELIKRKMLMKTCCIFPHIARSYRARGVRTCSSCHLYVQDMWHIMRCFQEDHNVTWTTTWKRAGHVKGEACVTWTIKLS